MGNIRTPKTKYFKNGVVSFYVMNKTIYFKVWLWLKNLPKLEPTKNVYNEMVKLPKKLSQRIHYTSPGKNRGMLRSITFKGIAEAMAQQWGGP